MKIKADSDNKGCVQCILKGEYIGKTSEILCRSVTSGKLSSEVMISLEDRRTSRAQMQLR